MINDLWYKNAIVYCLSVGTYMDANGDGVGDFLRLTRRLCPLGGGAGDLREGLAGAPIDADSSIVDGGC
jgi:hypothetical protein